MLLRKLLTRAVLSVLLFILSPALGLPQITGDPCLFGPSNAITVPNNSIGVTSTDSLILSNSTAAAAGAQQWSPRLRFTGQGWKTDATAASQTVDWIVENQPLQDDTRAATKLVFSSQANGGGYTPHFEVVDYDTGQQPAVPGGFVNARGTATNTSGAVDGLGMIMLASPTAATSAYYEGGDFFVQATTSNNFTRTFGGLIGSGVWVEANHTSPGTIDTMVGFQSYADVENTGSVTTLKLFEALNPDQFSSGTFGTVYGLYLRALTTGATNNFSIFTESGNAEINTGAAGTVGLRIDGTTSQSANLQEWRDVTPTVVASVSPSGVISSAAGTSAGNVATIDGTQTLTNKTLTTPTIASFTNATHDHTNAAGGGTLGKTAIPSTTVYTDQANTYSTGAQSFDAATSLDVPQSAGASPTQSSQVAYDTTSNTLEYGQNGTNRTIVDTGTSQILSNKSADESSNLFVLSHYIEYDAAGCQSGTGFTGFTYDATDAPASVNCIDGTNVDDGSLSFADAVTDRIHGNFWLPDDWESASMDLSGIWRSATESTNNVVWSIETRCVADAEVIEGSWNAAQTFTDAGKATTPQINTFAQTSVTTTGCAAGEMFYWRFARIGADGSDTFAGSADLMKLRFKIRRNH